MPKISVKTDWKILLSFYLGTFLEFFDYTLYGFFATTLGSLFFPMTSVSIQLMASWAIFAVGFIFRPLGGALFGYFADKFGRKKVICFTIVLMSSSTVCIGLLPTYEAIGLAAPLLLILCRILQGIAISGEVNATSIFVLENNLPNRGFLASFVPFSAGAGLICAGLLSYIFTVNAQSIPDLSWRLPFIISGLLVGFVGWYLRRKMHETASFIETKEAQQLSKNPLLDTIRNNKFAFVTNIVCSTYICAAAYLLLIYMSSYLKLYYGISSANSILIVALLTLINISVLPLAGKLSDKYDRFKILMYSCFLGCIFSFILALQSQLSINWFLVNVIFILIAYGFYDGPVTIFLPELYNTSNRYSATAFGYNIGGGAIGGFSPFIISVMIEFIPRPQFVLGLYLAIISGITGICLFLYRYRLERSNVTQVSFSNNNGNAVLLTGSS